ncbi:SDR family oxidoreductase [Escherichia coli]|nr:SDR family oxidoreductase [Escherichia coli]
MEKYVKKADIIFHLAGINRPNNESEFFTGNADFTKNITDILIKNDKKTPIVFSSSTQATNESPYGKSKNTAEKTLVNYSLKTGGEVYIYRLPNIFGKWCKPNYNSFIATFCYNSINNIELTINDPASEVELMYIDDVIAKFIEHAKGSNIQKENITLSPIYKSTVGEIAEIITNFKNDRMQIKIDEVGTGLKRALYATWLSYLTPEDFSYKIKTFPDHRGVFGEILKTEKNGQLSFFTAEVGVTRGGHYHHTKNEKFLVVQGKARFRFKHIITGQLFEKFVDATQYEIVDTVPGWSHDITNIGDEKLIVILWANEVFNSKKTDTIMSVI